MLTTFAAGGWNGRPRIEIQHAICRIVIFAPVAVGAG